jgi:hypothetical protein
MTAVMNMNPDLIRDWLQKVSNLYTIEYSFLERDWELHTHVSKKTKLIDRMDDDELDSEYELQKRYKGMHTPHKFLADYEEQEEMAAASPSSNKIYPRLEPAIGHYVHSTTGFAFISPTELKVFGRWDGAKLYPLDADDLEVCSIFRFYHDASRFVELTKKFPSHLIGSNASNAPNTSNAPNAPNAPNASNASNARKNVSSSSMF